MKTLSEVINALEKCTDYEAECEGCPYKDENEGGLECEMRNLEEVLGYLKEYRDSKAWLELEKKNYAEAIRNCDKAEAKYTLMVLDFNRNEPLTWDELKQMFHKPVWIETKTKSTWCIINDFDDECVNVIHTSHKGAKCSHFAKHLMGDTWQAYRKERG